jgi:hypothetical protein
MDVSGAKWVTEIGLHPRLISVVTFGDKERKIGLEQIENDHSNHSTDNKHPARKLSLDFQTSRHERIVPSHYCNTDVKLTNCSFNQAPNHRPRKAEVGTL